jgi:hypothetical protein
LSNSIGRLGQNQATIWADTGTNAVNLLPSLGLFCGIAQINNAYERFFL